MALNAGKLSKAGDEGNSNFCSVFEQNQNSLPAM